MKTPEIADLGILLPEDSDLDAELQSNSHRVPAMIA